MEILQGHQVSSHDLLCFPAISMVIAFSNLAYADVTVTFWIPDMPTFSYSYNSHTLTVTGNVLERRHPADINPKILRWQPPGHEHPPLGGRCARRIPAGTSGRQQRFQRPMDLEA